MFLRRPAAIFQPQFWVDDGKAFFVPAYLRGFGAFVEPYAGYLHAWPRIVAGFASLAPSRYAPLIYNTSALVLAAASVWTFCLPAARSLLRNDWIRLALCLSLVIAHPALETTNNLTNLHWWTSIGVLVLLSSRISGHWSSSAAALFAALGSLTCPIPMFYGPIAASLLWRRAIGHRVVACSVLAASAVQLRFQFVSLQTTQANLQHLNIADVCARSI